MFRFGNSWLEIRQGVKYMRLDETDAYQTGYACGRLLLDSGEPIIKLMKHPLARLFTSMLCWLTKKHFAKILVPQCYLDELRGYADSTGISYRHLFFMNFVFDVLKHYGFHCSTLAFFNADATLVGRNTDLLPSLASIGLKYYAPLILDVSIPGQARFSHFSIPFFVGVLNGFNGLGLAVHSHQIIEVEEKAAGPRLASSLLMRMLLEKAADLDDAARIVAANAPMRSLNVAVISERQRKGVVFEVHPQRWNALAHAGNFCCTTHFESESMSGLHDGTITPSLMRMASIRALAAEHSQPDRQTLVGMLKDQRNGMEHRISGKSLTNDGTYQSFIFDLTHSLILVSNGTRTPVSLTGDYVAVRVNGTAQHPFDDAA